MNKSFMHTNKLARQLGKWKEEQELLRWKRAELMTRLREAGFTFDDIASIYGCARQYVEQIVKEHQVNKLEKPEMEMA